ncbi:hypothetical protein BaRGS_00002658, partial [Batillaria attramentaria]
MGTRGLLLLFVLMLVVNVDPTNLNIVELLGQADRGHRRSPRGRPGCSSSSECGATSCCVTLSRGTGRGFCHPLGEYGDVCLVSYGSDKPGRTNIPPSYFAVCPCRSGLVCVPTHALIL